VTTGLRQKVRQVTHRIYHKFSTIRRLLDEVHGEGKAFVLATIEGPTARTARRLLRQCELALAQLLDPSVELPTHELDGIELNPLKLALGLRPDVDLLRSLLADLRRERRVLQKTRKEKNQAVEDHRRTLVWTARTVEGYYMLAGEVELAERLRPATRRKSSPQTEGEDQTPPQGGTPEETSPPDESPLPEASETAPSPTDA
jgi:hypothetical protein